MASSTSGLGPLDAFGVFMCIRAAMTEDHGRPRPALAIPEATRAALISRLGARSIVFIGLMGAGKTAIGRRVAGDLDLPFLDSDHEIEEAAGCSIPELFSRYGEDAFRDGERRVIHRLLEGPRHVLATGGGAFMDPATRALV